MMLSRSQNLLSADGNYIQQQARVRCQFYSPAINARYRGWPRLKEIGLADVGKDAIYMAFELTCIAVKLAWSGVNGQDIYEAQISWLTEVGAMPNVKQLTLF
jgi:hypothetical protein